MTNLDTVEFFFQQAWQSTARNGLMALAAICNMAVAFAALGAFVLLAWNLEYMARSQSEEAVITVDLAHKAKAQDVETALKRDPRIRQTKFVGRDEALKQYADRMKLDLKALKLIDNPIPDSFTVWPSDPNDIPALAASIAKIPGVSTDSRGVRYGGQVTKKLLSLARAAKAMALALTLLLGGAALLIVGTTIRLTIYARRREVRIMQLVGATNWFIRLPFIIEGVLQGLAGALIAAVVLLLGYRHLLGYISQNLDFLDLVHSTPALVTFGLGIVVVGIAFGALGAYLGLRRHLRVV
jgi:cell division transport system permease protein